MKQTIEKLWNGSIVPVEKCGAGDPYVGEPVELMKRNREAFSQKLDKQQMDDFEKYIDCTEEYIYMTSVYAFQEGCCLAGKLAMESFYE